VVTALRRAWRALRTLAAGYYAAGYRAGWDAATARAQAELRTTLAAINTGNRAMQQVMADRAARERATWANSAGPIGGAR
jgi:aspartate/methionine/tyrosine aminotransferase